MYKKTFEDLEWLSYFIRPMDVSKRPNHSCKLVHCQLKLKNPWNSWEELSSRLRVFLKDFPYRNGMEPDVNLIYMELKWNY